MADDIVIGTNGDEYIHYLKALEIFKNRFPGVTKQEIAIWAWLGQRGGIVAYVKGGADKMLEAQFHIGVPTGDNPKRWDFTLKNVSFRRIDVEMFEPECRWLTFEQLCSRWKCYFNDGDEMRSQIVVRCETEELLAYHPRTGLSREAVGDKDFPPVEVCMFDLRQVEAIEMNDFPDGAVLPVGVTATARPLVQASSVMSDIRPAPAKAIDTRIHPQNVYLWRVFTKLSEKLKREPTTAEVKRKILDTWMNDEEINDITGDVIEWAHSRRPFDMSKSLCARLSQLKKNPPYLS